LGGARVRALESDGLAAVYSRHRSLRARPSREGVLAHERVLEAIMERGPVLPLRFGTELESENDLAAVLDERRDELLRALERVRGRVELGLRVLPERRDGAARGGERSGREYLLARVDEHRRAERAAAELHPPLAALASASRLQEQPAPPAILVGSYLVAEDQIEAFRARVDELATRHRELQLVVTGPWPPYSFATEEDR
jgi:Gas vesicle synthesis protein GvpL/GvpF